MCKEKEYDQLMMAHQRSIAALKAMTATMTSANERLKKAYKKLPENAGPFFELPEIGLSIEAGMSHAADILEGKVAA